jgi:hypothetical protein
MSRCVVCEVVVLGGGSPKIGNNIDALEETSYTRYSLSIAPSGISAHL